MDLSLGVPNDSAADAAVSDDERAAKQEGQPASLD